MKDLETANKNRKGGRIIQEPKNTPFEKKLKPKLNPAKATSWTLIGISAVALVISIIYESSFLAFIGLALLFWGAILTYIRSDEYVKQPLLDATALSSLSTINQIMQELDYRGKGIYLPPKYFTDPKVVRAYIPKQNDSTLPTPEQTQKQESQLFLDSPEGILLEPPGAQLLELLERALGTDFVRVDVEYLKQNMPRAFIEDLEICRNFKMEGENDRIQVSMEDSVYYSLHEETRKLSNVYNSLGCPLSSAVACSLAKATGKPIIIENQKTDKDSKSIIIEYRVAKEEQPKQ